MIDEVFSAEQAVQAFLAAATEAQTAIETTIGVRGALAIVQAVLKGRAPRKGHCLNGLEYFVHGVGYTVVRPDGDQVHIDGCSDGDLFSIYDVAFFFESADVYPVPSNEALELELDKLAASGVLRKAGPKRYLML